MEQVVAKAWRTVIAYDSPGVVATASGSIAGEDAPWQFTFQRN